MTLRYASTLTKALGRLCAAEQKQVKTSVFDLAQDGTGNGPSFTASTAPGSWTPRVSQACGSSSTNPVRHLYPAEPNAGTYLSLLDLVQVTKTAIAALDPRDNLDVQSFIWVVSEHGEGVERE
jgi:hypothetical protein